MNLVVPILLLVFLFWLLAPRRPWRARQPLPTYDQVELGDNGEPGVVSNAQAAGNSDQKLTGHHWPSRARIFAGSVAVAGVLAVAALCWHLLEDYRLEQQVRAISSETEFEIGMSPTVGDVEDWLRKHDYENIDRRFACHRFRGHDGSFVVVSAEKRLTDGWPWEEAKYLVLSFGWDEQHNGAFWGIEPKIRTGADEHRPAPATMPRAVP